MNNDDIMALYSKPSPFGAPQQNFQSTQSMQNSQFGFAAAPQQNVMSMSQPAGFNQFPAQNWPNDGFTSMSSNQPANNPPAFSSPPAQKPATSAFDDLFAIGTAHFASPNNSQNNFANKVQTPTTTSTAAAHQDLESLFM